MAKDITKIEIPGQMPWEKSKGHRPHRSGAGKHLDKRTKRQRTREAAEKKAIEDKS
jgi:hypothetical protein